MNVASWLLWGFAATMVLTALLGMSQGLHVTRMNIPYLLGTMVTPDRDGARLLGVGIHLVNGLIFALIYVAVFHAWSGGWWRGALIGLVHAIVVLTVGMPTLPSVHPRMASEEHGPSPTPQLEPPGFMALHYGYATPVSILIAHVLFGAMLGRFYAVT